MACLVPGTAWAQGAKPAAAPAGAGAAKPAPQPGTAAGEAAKPAEAAGVSSSKYVPLPVDDSLRKSQPEIMGLLRAGTVPPDKQTLFEDFYKKYELARWTSPDELTRLPVCRRSLSNALGMARGKPIHDQLAALAFDYLKTMANDPTRHPAARFNAMLAIGDLNEQEAAGPNDTPVPYKPALPVLVQAVTDPKQIEAVRLAALVGLLRHAKLGIADAAVRSNQVLPAVRTIAETKAPAGRSVEGNAWVRARAIDVLWKLGEVGPQNAVVNLLTATVADGDDQLLARTAAARALGNLNYPANHGLDAWRMAADLGRLASDTCVAELAQIQKDTKKAERKSRRGMGGMMGGYDMYGAGGPEMYMPEMAPGEMGTMPEGYMPDQYMPEGYMPGGMMRKKEQEKEDETLGNRRRLKAYLNAVVIGLTGKEGKDWNPAEGPPKAGVVSLAAPDQAALVNGVLEQVVNLFRLCDKKGLDRKAFSTELETQLAALTEAINKGPGTPAEEPPAAAPPAAAPPAEPAAAPAKTAPASPPAAAPAEAAPAPAGPPAAAAKPAPSGPPAEGAKPAPASPPAAAPPAGNP